MITELDALKFAIQYKVNTLKSEIEEDESRIDEYTTRNVDKAIMGVEIGMTAEKKRMLEWLEKLRGEK